MDVSKYIAEFLGDKGYVLLPGLGSFVSAYKPAHFDDQQTKMLPPGKVFSFDPAKNSGDVNLSRFVAGRENIPLSLAEKEIEEYVDGCHYVINKGKRLEIPGVGLLFKGEQGQLLYEQDLSLSTEGDFFGLPEIPVRQLKKSRQLPWGKLLLAAGILALLILGGFYARQISNFLKEKSGSIFARRDTTGLNQVAAPTLTTDTFVMTKDTIPVPDSLITPKTESQSIENQPAVNQGSGSEKVPVNQKNKLAAEGKQFYVVAGCFLSKERADNTAARLKKSGYHARVFGTSTQGLTMVCYESYPTRAEALQTLEKIRKEHNPQAWLILY